MDLIVRAAPRKLACARQNPPPRPGQPIPPNKGIWMHYSTPFLCPSDPGRWVGVRGRSLQRQNPPHPCPESNAAPSAHAITNTAQITMSGHPMP